MNLRQKQNWKIGHTWFKTKNKTQMNWKRSGNFRTYLEIRN